MYIKYLQAIEVSILANWRANERFRYLTGSCKFFSHLRRLILAVQDTII